MQTTKYYFFKYCLPGLLLLMAFFIPAHAQTVTVSGLVTESTGEPVPGVNVVVKGATLAGTITNAQGHYTLEGVPADATLIYSFIGFKTQEVAVEGRTHISLVLEEEITTLAEVIVNTGYYTVKERERTGSIVKVSAKEIEGQPVGNVLAAVQGRTAGVSITQGSGVPGGGYDIKIRGTNSLRRAGNYPMYIIDGVPVSADTPAPLSGAILPNTEINPLNALNPNDIESIEILKDADATAIYGSRGANGVVLVTTKKGRTGGQTAFTVNSSYGLSRVAGKMEMMNTEQYLAMRREAFANDGIDTYPANAYDVNGVWDENRFTDWQEELIGGTAVSSNVQLSVSGGSEQTSFLLSGSRNRQTTVFENDFEYENNNMAGNLSHRSADNRLTLTASGQFSAQSNNQLETDISSQAFRLSPNAPALYQEDGTLNWENNTFTNPIAAYESTYTNDGKSLNANLNMGYELLPAFHVKLNGGINHQVFEEMVLRPNTIYNPAFGITPASSMTHKSRNQRFSYLAEPQLNFRQSFNDHQLDVLVGGAYQQTNNSYLRLTGTGFESNALMTNLAAASRLTVSQDSDTEYKYAALFGRINYQFKSRYILNLTGRRDGSSRFGPDKRFANFGAIGAAWLFSEEEFLMGSTWLSFGKLRGSYGVTGSDLIGDYQYMDTYTVSSAGYGGSVSLYPSRLHNPYFSWEKTTKLEMALEAGFLNDRLHFSAAWFRNRSGNQLVGIPLPGTTGFSSIQANLPATVENKGFEWNVQAILMRSRSFSWSSGFNISLPKNKLVEFPGLEGSTYANTYVVGQPLSIVKVYNYEGIDAETGLYTFTDYNGDGNISSPDDNQVIEELGVQAFGGWTNQLSFNNWEFSFLFQFVKQRQRNYAAQMTNPGTLFNQPVELLDTWSPDHPNGEYMPYTTGAHPPKYQAIGYYRNSNATIEDASFIRLKNIQLSYRLPVNHYVKDVRFYVQGQNLLTLTDYFGIDPEFVLTGFLPPLKTVSMGVQLNF
jgi:TonB-linked SusC/RagA family outer membrane protein